jgi:hypothetical protein
MVRLSGCMASVGAGCGQPTVRSSPFFSYARLASYCLFSSSIFSIVQAPGFSSTSSSERPASTRNAAKVCPHHVSSGSTRGKNFFSWFQDEPRCNGLLSKSGLRSLLASLSTASSRLKLVIQTETKQDRHIHGDIEACHVRIVIQAAHGNNMKERTTWNVKGEVITLFCSNQYGLHAYQPLCASLNVVKLQPDQDPCHPFVSS